MTTILHIIASPRGDDSQSSRLAETYLTAEKTSNADVAIDVLDLWKENLPEFDGDKTAAKMTVFGSGELDGAQQTEWDEIVAITERFMTADIYVLSVPMWNCGIPYKLKQYIDVITQPGLLFGFDPINGYSGLLQNKKAHVFYTSGVYAPHGPQHYGVDFHATYLSWWLNFIGIQEIEDVRLPPPLLAADPDSDLKAAVFKSVSLAGKHHDSAVS